MSGQTPSIDEQTAAQMKAISTMQRMMGTLSSGSSFSSALNQKIVGEIKQTSFLMQEKSQKEGKQTEILANLIEEVLKN